MGKQQQEAAAPSLAKSPAHQAALVPSTEVSRSSGNCLSPKPSEGPAIVPSASFLTMRSNAPGVPSTASSAPSPPATAAASPAADESYEEIRSVVGIVPCSHPTQSEDLVPSLEEALRKDSMAKFDPSVKRFLDRSSDQLVTTSIDLNNDPTTGLGSNLPGTSLLEKLIENEGGTSRICDTSAKILTGTMDTGNAMVSSSFKAWRNTRALSLSQRIMEKSKNRFLQNLTLQRDLQQGYQPHVAALRSTVSQGPPRQRDSQQGIQTHGAASQITVSQEHPLISSCESDILSDIVKSGTMDTGNAMVPSSFKAWRNPRVLSPLLRKREKNENQWLLRRCLQNLTLQRDLQQGIQTHGAVSQSIASQGPPLTTATSMPHLSADKAPTMDRMTREKNRRVQLSKSFAALRGLVPIISKNDKASILGDTIAYLEDLKKKIDELEASKSQVERQYEDLKLSHQDLEQRNQQLEASKSQVERQYEDQKLSHQDLERRHRLFDPGSWT